MIDRLVTKTMKKNMEQLEHFFFEMSDPRCPGENPTCVPLEDAIRDELAAFSDEDLLEFAEGLDEREGEYLFGVLTILSDDREVLRPKWA